MTLIQQGRFYRRAFYPIISSFFSRNLLIFQISLIFPPKYVKFNKPVFFLLENFTNSDRTPPNLDTHLSISNYFQNLEILGKSSPIRVRVSK